MTDPTDNVLVMYSHDVRKLMDFFSGMGLSFQEEKHGDGPVHYAAERYGKVFEIYPATSRRQCWRFLND